MEYAIEASNKHIDKLFDAIMPSIVDQLGLNNSRRAVLIKVTPDVPEGFIGATYNIEFADCLMVLIAPPTRVTQTALLDVALTLAHEMVHVRQLAKGIMKFLPNGSRMWMGKKYTKKTPYMDQPWELDAFAKQEIILRRAIESY